MKSFFNVVINATKFGVVNKSTTVNRFVLHTLQRNITHLAVITRKTNIKLGILKGGGGELEKSPIMQKKSALDKLALFQFPPFKIPSIIFVLRVITAKRVMLRCKV